MGRLPGQQLDLAMLAGEDSEELTSSLLRCRIMGHARGIMKLWRVWLQTSYLESKG